MAARSRIRRVLAIAFKTVVVGLMVLIVAGVVYEELGRARDRRRLSQIGQSIDVGGRTLNMYCAGEGGPAVILDTGRGTPGYSWAHIHAEIAKLTRACWFDRAGEGWSDIAPSPQSSAALARDLHELLTRAGVPAPYVLVGHSLGGLNARVYTGLFPGEVAGLVLVDAAHEDEPRRAPEAYRGRTLPRYLWNPVYQAGRFAARVGLLRLLAPAAPLPTDPSRLTSEQIVEALRRQPKSLANAFSATAPESYAEAQASSGFGNRPLIVLTRGKALAGANDPGIDRESAEYERVWVHEIQPQLARLSTEGRQVIIESSGHRIPEEAPEAVVGAVREVLEKIREVKLKGSAGSVMKP